tara:strand:+ start:2220 stop:3113 length:894 start_codon:yes stop_codon:yes gene_type:complete
MDINKENLRAVTQGYTTVFNNAFSAAAALYGRVAMEVPSNSASNTYGWLGKTTRFRKWLGDRVVQNLKTHQYTILNEKFEDTVAVGKDDIEDDTYGTYRPMFEMLGHDAAMHPDELVFDLMKNGFDSTCYDGQYFFDTDHPVIGNDGQEVSVSNFQDGAGDAWFLLDVSKPIRPFIFQKRRDYNFVAKDNPEDDNVFWKDEFVYGVDARVAAGYALWQLAFGSKAALDNTNYQAARAAMMSVKGDNGKPLGVRPNLLVVPPSLEAAAKEILEAERKANGATNTERNTAELLVVPYLA